MDQDWDPSRWAPKVGVQACWLCDLHCQEWPQRLYGRLLGQGARVLKRLGKRTIQEGNRGHGSGATSALMLGFSHTGLPVLSCERTHAYDDCEASNPITWRFCGKQAQIGSFDEKIEKKFS